MERSSTLISVRLSNRVAISFVLSIMILIVFYLISNSFNDWTWFARSGALLVSIGVVTASYDIKGQMEKSKVPDAFISQAIILEASIVVIGTLVWGFGDLLVHIA